MDNEKTLHYPYGRSNPAKGKAPPTFWPAWQLQISKFQIFEAWFTVNICLNTFLMSDTLIH